MMQSSHMVATHFGVSIFEMFAQEIDDVIMLLNYVIELGEQKPQPISAPATGGANGADFWDFD